ncbi:hypothetical protein [Microcoleus sp. FACHB-68]|uniref:hypothetical protein n=1 Tax=Microcoleus sp. FACHB-68 TaxID=2692826 RepID=UPI001686FD9F|nr:hypothetical protein [Microcoleus sp. FACHB-68]MBD1940592.1 hypothetical protein [Microcoleus sp. FACHB-68]
MGHWARLRQPKGMGMGHWAWGIGHGARLRQPKGMGIGHGALGMGHGAWGIGEKLAFLNSTYKMLLNPSVFIYVWLTSDCPIICGEKKAFSQLPYHTNR